MAVHIPPSPQQDLISPPSQRYQPVPSLFPSAEFAGDEEWFFNMKIHKTDYKNGVLSPRKPNQLDPMTTTTTTTTTRSRKTSKASPPGHSRGPGDQTAKPKPQFRSRNRKLESFSKPSPAELKEEIDNLTARSIGDSLIFHNIPEECEGTPESEVVKFCQDYLVGRKTKHVKFGQVHKMEPRFSKDAPIAARFKLRQSRRPPPSDDQQQAAAAEEAAGEKYEPQPYVPLAASPKKKLPVLKAGGKSPRKKAPQYNAD